MHTKAVTFFASILCILGLTACEEAITYRNAAELMGLVSGETYPLFIGDKIMGTVGDITTEHGFFSSRSSLILTPGSAVTVIFKKNNKEWHLEIPTSKTTFIIDESLPQSVELFIDSGTYYGGGMQNFDCSDYKTAAECSARLAENAGLGAVIQEALLSATFTVSQATADQLSGRKSPVA